MNTNAFINCILLFHIITTIVINKGPFILNLSQNYRIPENSEK